VTSANRLDENIVGLGERGKVAVRQSRNQLDLQRPTYSVNSRRFTISAAIYRIALKPSSGTRWRHDWANVASATPRRSFAQASVTVASDILANPRAHFASPSPESVKYPTLKRRALESSLK
jgi:hypothetical protein